MGNAKRTAQVLFVHADSEIWGYVRDLLNGPYSLSVCANSSEASATVKNGFRPDVVLLDADSFHSDALVVLSELRAVMPTIPVVMLSAAISPKVIVQAIRSGARDVLQKPFGKLDLLNAVQACLSSVDSSMLTDAQEIPLDEDVSFVHSSKKMKDIRAQCGLVARVDLPVLILGESGTGKEVLAKYIHKSSPRAHRTFMKVNCAAMPADLLESELFGYEQGAFTGAVKAKPGKFEICNNGTILLDEIGEMPPSLQAKLLHVLQDGTFSRLGSRTTVKVDVRVIAATNIDMKAAIAERKFREDLYYRLNGFTLSLPPLRERKEEIVVLIQYFMRKIADKYGRTPLPLSPELQHACMNYSWPGNLRELENFVKRFLVLGDEQIMLNELMPSCVRYVESADPTIGGLKRMSRSVKDDAEAMAIAKALEATRWNRKQAASQLQISYKALLYKIKQFNLVPPVTA